MIWLVLACLGLAGCGVDGLAFATDDRLEIVSPEDRAEVTLPVTVEWTVRDFEAGPEAGRFGIYIDRAPQPPGEPQSWFAREDKSCLPAEGCPDEEYLADRGVYSTSDTSFTIDVLPRTVSAESARREFHEFTIVLLGEDGRRIGESAWFVDFQVERG